MTASVDALSLKMGERLLRETVERDNAGQYCSQAISTWIHFEMGATSRGYVTIVNA